MAGMGDNRTIGDWIAAAKRKIDTLDAELIAARAFGPRICRDRAWLATHLDDELDLSKVIFADIMCEKREQGMPLAYVFGEKEFYGRIFLVSSETLIPRPETEDLIELIKSLKLSRFARFLEVGTGSGCIAVTLALEFPQSYVLATDISEAALEIAIQNDAQHEGRVDFLQSDLLSDLDLDDDEEYFESDTAGIEREFDVVVANLPYVDRKWDWLDKETLGYEPDLALYAKDKGLALYKRFFWELRKLETKYVVIEADPCQHVDLAKAAKKRGFELLKTQGFGMVFVPDQERV